MSETQASEGDVLLHGLLFQLGQTVQSQTSFFPIIYENMLPSKHALPIYLVLLICGAAELCVLPAEFPAGQAGDKNTVESTEPIFGSSILSHSQDSNTDSECSLVNLLTVM